jgi:hypothetical protein
MASTTIKLTKGIKKYGAGIRLGSLVQAPS